MKKEFHSFKKKKKWITFLEWKLSVVFARFWFKTIPLPLLLLTQHLWLCLPTETIPIKSCYYSLHSASSTSPNGAEKTREGRNMKVRFNSDR